MARRRFLIAYDICEPQRLRQVCKVMQSYGERLQYSLFVCDLNRTELIRARTEVEAQMKLSEDSVVIVDLGDIDTARFTFIGQRRPLPTHGARIV
jgi:CRISPR-associated protein Cas2